MLPEALKGVAAAEAIEQWDAQAITGGVVAHGQVTMHIDAGKVVEVCRFLKDEQRYNRLSGITAVDWYPAEPRFEVVYLLHSLPRNERLRLKCMAGGEPAEIDSVTGVWKSANWYEREVFDMFGITFRNHPDLRRILMPEDWQGHPLRRDYPVHGYKYSYQGE